MAPRAAARLELLGFTDVSHYKAGKLDWMAAGLPTEGENAARPRAGTVARKDVPVCSLTDRGGDVPDRARAARWCAAVDVDSTRFVPDVVSDGGVVIDSRCATRCDLDRCHATAVTVSG